MVAEIALAAGLASSCFAMGESGRRRGMNSEPNVEEAVPFFMVYSMEESLRCYVDGLGFTMTHKWIPQGRVEWCRLQRGGGALMLQEYGKGRKPEGARGLGVSICFTCKDAIALYHEFSGRGIEASKPFVGNQMWVTSITDPDGYRVFFESPTDVPEETEYTEPGP